MKMTGHLMFGKWAKTKSGWVAEKGTPLADPYNRFIHFIFFFTSSDMLAFSDMRKFGKIMNLFDNAN